jgi:hypothetical protein
MDKLHFKFEISGNTETSKESKRLKIGFRIINSELRGREDTKEGKER